LPPPGYRLERLADHHDLASFEGGALQMDQWLRRHARQADRKDTARTYVWSDDRSVIAYFSLAPHWITRGQTPSELGRGSPERIPCILLARLALAGQFQRRPERFGSMLLVEALTLAVEVSRKGGGRLIVVDAIDADAADFYEHHGFIPSPDRYRLMMKVSDAALSIGLPWP
jgi:predicted GNAT family N-acyltransferase